MSNSLDLNNENKKSRLFSSKAIKFILKTSMFVSLLTGEVFATTPMVNNEDDVTQWVDPFIGTGGDGHTFPGAVVPFGMVQLSPDTAAVSRSAKDSMMRRE